MWTTLSEADFERVALGWQVGMAQHIYRFDQMLLAKLR